MLILPPPLEERMGKIYILLNSIARDFYAIIYSFVRLQILTRSDSQIIVYKVM